MLGRLKTLLSGLSKKDKRRPASPTRLGESLQSTNSAPAAVLGSAAAAHAAAAAATSAAAGHDAGAAAVASSNGGGHSTAAAPSAALKQVHREQLVVGHRRSSSDGSLPLPQLLQQTQQPQQMQPCPAPLPQHSNGGSGVLRTNSGSGCSRRASLLSDSGRASRRSSLAQSTDGPLPQSDATMPPGEHQQQQLRGDASCVAPQLPLHLLHPQRAADSPPPSVAQHQQQTGMSSSGASTPDPPHAHHQPQLPLAAAIGAAAAGATWSFGMHSEKNQRSAMEDRSQAVDLTGSDAFPGAGRAGFFAVFDGHAGHEAAQYLADHMLGYVLAAGPGALSDNPLAVLGDAVQRAESELVAGNRCAGSTLCALLLVDDKLHVAHVGDSRAVLGRGTEARQLTRDHKPLCRIEAARVAADDPAAEISSDGYIYGEFAVTRAIGSAHFKRDPSKRALIARPDLTTVQLAPEDDFVVVASDGVWDVLPNAEAVSATRRALASVRDAAAAARTLVDRAQRRASSDNISVIMLLLHSRAISMPKSNSMLFRRSGQLSSMAAAAGGGGGGTGSGGDSPRSYSSTAPCSGTSTPLNMTPRSSTPVLCGTPVRERDGGSGIEPAPAAAAATTASSPVPAGR